MHCGSSVKGYLRCCTPDRVQRVGVALEFAREQRRSSQENIWKAGGAEEQ